MPKWYAKDNEPQTQPGVSMGLTVMLDGHSDLIATSSLESDYQGFAVMISNRETVPRKLHKVLQVIDSNYCPKSAV